MNQYRITCEKLGDLATLQGAHTGAAKKYLDAGNKLKVRRVEAKREISKIFFIFSRYAHSFILATLIKSPFSQTQLDKKKFTFSLRII